LSWYPGQQHKRGLWRKDEPGRSGSADFLDLEKTDQILSYLCVKYLNVLKMEADEWAEGKAEEREAT
jgi:hypothetical protein